MASKCPARGGSAHGITLSLLSILSKTLNVLYSITEKKKHKFCLTVSIIISRMCALHGAVIFVTFVCCNISSTWMVPGT